MHFQKKYYSEIIPSLYISICISTYQSITPPFSNSSPNPNQSFYLYQPIYPSPSVSLSLSLSLPHTLFLSLSHKLSLTLTFSLSPSLSSSKRHVPLISVVQHKESRVCKLAPSLLKEYCKFHALFEQKSAWMIGIKSI